MTKEAFDEGLKLLKRFLKEEGLYVPIYKKYLFRKNRPTEDLFKEFNNPHYYFENDAWCYLFRRTNLISGCNNDFDYDEFLSLIVNNNNNISAKWVDFYNAHHKL